MYKNDTYQWLFTHKCQDNKSYSEYSIVQWYSTNIVVNYDQLNIASEQQCS